MNEAVTMQKKVLAFVLILSIFVTALSGCTSGGPVKGLLPELSASARATPNPTPTPIDKTPENAALLYCRGLLEGELLEDYDSILYGLSRHEASIGGLHSDSEGIAKAVSYIFADNPKLFWFSGGGMSNTFDGLADGSFEPIYTMTEAEALQAQAVIDARVSSFLSGIPANASDYDKALAVYEYVVYNTDYDLSLDSNSIHHIFLDGKGICGCYSKTTQYLLNLMGIRCVTVSGYAVNDLGQDVHAWNLLMLDGDWYWMDTTWGDPVSYGDAGERIAYDYFCLTTEAMSLDHFVDDSFPVPECTATADNYYVHSGLLYEVYDFYTVRDALLAAADAGQEELRIRFSGREAYDAAIGELLNNERIFEIYYDSLGSPQCSYYTDDSKYSIEFILP